MTDDPSPPRPSSALPPPSQLEPPATEQRAQSHPTGPAVKGPKLPAMSPPAAGQNGQTGQSSKFGSPETRRENDFQTVDQYTALANLIKNSDQAIVRQVLRDNWAQCLVGSEYHAAFSVSAPSESSLLTSGRTNDGHLTDKLAAEHRTPSSIPCYAESSSP
jgi:hypothetical protein